MLICFIDQLLNEFNIPPRIHCEIPDENILKPWSAFAKYWTLWPRVGNVTKFHEKKGHNTFQFALFRPFTAAIHNGHWILSFTRFYAIFWKLRDGHLRRFLSPGRNFFLPQVTRIQDQGDPIKTIVSVFLTRFCFCVKSEFSVLVRIFFFSFKDRYLVWYHTFSKLTFLKGNYYYYYHLLKKF